MLRNLEIRMLSSVVSKEADRSSSDKMDKQHCLRPEVDQLLHAIRRFQCCDTFGRQTGCETVNAAKTVIVQYAPVSLTRMANWKQAGSVSGSRNQDQPFLMEV